MTFIAFEGLIMIGLGCLIFYLTREKRGESELRTLMIQRSDKFSGTLKSILGVILAIAFIFIGLILLLANFMGHPGVSP